MRDSAAPQSDTVGADKAAGIDSGHTQCTKTDTADRDLERGAPSAAVRSEEQVDAAAAKRQSRKKLWAMCVSIVLAVLAACFAGYCLWGDKDKIRVFITDEAGGPGRGRRATHEDIIRMNPIRLLLVGDQNVGKKTLVQCLIDNNTLQLNTPENDGQLPSYSFKDGKATYNVSIYNPPHERFRNKAVFGYYSKEGIIVVFDMTNVKSFKDASDWLDTISLQAPDCENVILVGNKAEDRNKVAVSDEAIQSLYRDTKLVYFETSAKECANVQQAFSFIIGMAHGNRTRNAQQQREREA